MHPRPSTSTPPSPWSRLGSLMGLDGEGPPRHNVTAPRNSTCRTTAILSIHHQAHCHWPLPTKLFNATRSHQQCHNITGTLKYQSEYHQRRRMLGGNLTFWQVGNHRKAVMPPPTNTSPHGWGSANNRTRPYWSHHNHHRVHRTASSTPYVLFHHRKRVVDMGSVISGYLGTARINNWGVGEYQYPNCVRVWCA